MAFSIVKYVIVILVGLVVGFAVHISVLNFLEVEPFQNKIVLAYILNYLAASFIVGALYIVREKQKDNLGGLFMFGSAIKFAIFFIVFYPSYTSDDNMTKLEFFTFFVPYFISLILETLALIKLLEYLDYRNVKNLKNKG